MEFGIVGMLEAAWVASILPMLIASLPFSKLGWFNGLVLGFAKRGKIMPNSPSYKLTVPQRFFCHFYVVGVVWTTVLLSATWIYASNTAASMVSELAGSPSLSSDKSHSISIRQRYELWLSVFLLVLMEAQVLRRLFETIYVFKYSPSARMHIFGYVTGLFFYTAAPLSLCCRYASEAFKYGADSISEGKGFQLDWWAFLNPLLKLGWLPWIAAAVFLWGWIHQLRCHAILGSLRSQGKKMDEYVIPCGDWFELVSSAHYLAEIVIYAAFVVATGGTDLTIWLLFGFVVANLALAAGETHRWYLRKFDTYPRNRFAIIPFVY
ncbi:Polyprenol reductase 2 [Linum grandiflorum]